MHNPSLRRNGNAGKTGDPGSRRSGGRTHVLQSRRLRKQLLPLLPYAVLALVFTKAGQALRLAPGSGFGEKLLHIAEGFSAAFASPLPSFHPGDLAAGILLALLLRTAVLVRGRNRKRFRKNEEYGSARWGRPEDIAPFVDPVFRNNVILTGSEFLTMESRSKNPAYSRNKNVLVIGGSGSGKTRFFVKPNLMQMHSSYVITDPKGALPTILEMVNMNILRWHVFTDQNIERKRSRNP